MVKYIFLVICLSGCSYMAWYPEDNFAEEIVEEIIEQKLGLDIDLTDSSEEK